MPEEELEAPIIEMDPDELQQAIQDYDTAYFEEHPESRYHVRAAFENEFAMGSPDYRGLVLVYVLQAGIRIRKPVASIDEGREFVVRYEQHDSNE